MGFKCGIIGLPNVGKSTLFNALTKANSAAENFLFCTIKPNTGVVTIPDPRIDQIAEIVNPQHIVPTTMQFVDIAGLVKGSSKGEGLGNQFLANIRETEALAHVIRCFESDNIIHVTGEVNPSEDISVINTELALSDLEVCEQAISQVKKRSKGGDTDAKMKLLTLEKCLIHLSHFSTLRTLDLSNDEKRAIRYLNFLTLKPIMYIANVNEDGFEANPYLDQVHAIAKADGSLVIAICATIESDITELKKKECDKFIAELGPNTLGLHHIIRAGYKLLSLQTYFTVGVKIVRAWTISIGATASQAAGKIHTNFEKGFIRAKTISFNDFITYRGEQGAKEAGKMRFEGREYIVKDGDIMHFLFNI